MPNQAFPIAVTVFDGANVALSGVNVNLRNTSNGESLATDKQGTTDTNGEATVNAYDFTTSVTDGQGYELVFSLDGYDITKIVSTFDISDGSHEYKITLQLSSIQLSKKIRETIHSVSSISAAKKSFEIWANTYTCSGSAEAVKTGDGRGNGVTDTDISIVNLLPGQVAYIQQISVMLQTDSKSVKVAPAKFSQRKGLGTITAVGHESYLVRGTSVQLVPYTIKFANPIRVEYNSDLAQSIGIKVTGTDSSTVIDVSMEGYVLDKEV